MNTQSSQQQPNSNSQVRSSSSFRNFFSSLCPCFNISNQHVVSRSKPKNYDKFLQERQNIKKSKINTTPKNPILNYQSSDQHTEQTIIGVEISKKPDLVSFQDIQLNFDEQQVKNQLINMNLGPPCNDQEWTENILAGKLNNKLICIVQEANIEKSKTSEKLTNKAKKYESNGKMNPMASQIDKHWDQRYYFFSKFDEGVLIDDNNWNDLIPEVISEHISSQISCETILNINCGAGGQAIKLGNTCKKVLAWDPNPNNLKSLAVNMKVYETQNIEVLESISKQSNLQYQILFVSHSKKYQEEVQYIIQILQSYLCEGGNFVIITSSSIDVNEMCYKISQMYSNSNRKPQSCTIRVQKIFYDGQLKYQVFYFGTALNKSFTTNDELKWIYRRLGVDGKKNAGKKLVKKLRERYGMVKLLSFVLQSVQFRGDIENAEKMFQYVRRKQLMKENKLQEIKDEWLAQRKLALEYDQNFSENTRRRQEGHSKDDRESTISDLSTFSNMNIVSGTQIRQSYDPYKSLSLSDMRQTLRISKNREKSESPKKKDSGICKSQVA